MFSRPPRDGRSANKIEYVIEPIAALDGRYIEAHSKVGWIDPSNATQMAGVICHAYDGDWEIGRLALDSNGKVLIVEVELDWRRQGIATRMIEGLIAQGHSVEHDWDNMHEDGAAWVASLEKADQG